jgi:Flp pilus assembly pilin Flp
MLGFKNFLMDEEGVGVVEMVLIVVVLIGIVVLFKKKITTLVTDIFSTITERSGEV